MYGSHQSPRYDIYIIRIRFHFRRRLFAMLKILLRSFLFSALVTPAFAQDFKIITLGDMPYGDPAMVYPPYEALIEAINQKAVDLVIHVGDTKGGGSCSDRILNDQLRYMNSFSAPLIYTPGDNEWTDCAHMTGGADDPIERLAYIRNTYFSEPSTSFGVHKISLEHQGEIGFPENARFTKDGITVISAHVVGSNNNLQATDIASVEEFFSRSKATTEWMVGSFDAAMRSDIIVLAIHADMFEFDFNEFNGERWLRHSGFSEFGYALQRAARKFAKPVLLVFGDSHVHKVFKPFPQSAPNVTAMEVYGYHEMHAVEITISPKEIDPFRFQTVWNPTKP